jgi:hypothetical protein
VDREGQRVRVQGKSLGVGILLRDWHPQYGSREL